MSKFFFIILCVVATLSMSQLINCATKVDPRKELYTNVNKCGEIRYVKPGDLELESESNKQRIQMERQRTLDECLECCRKSHYKYAGLYGDSVDTCECSNFILTKWLSD